MTKATDRNMRIPGVAFLLSQLGGQSARAWAAGLAAVGMEPREAMLLRHVALAEGSSQQKVATLIGLPASRIVGIVDRLEAKGWVERRRQGTDRRRRELYLTPLGHRALETVMAVGRDHEQAFTKALSPSERNDLIRLLERVASAERLIEGVHPGFADPEADQTQEP